MVKGKRLNQLGAEIIAGHFSVLSGVTQSPGAGDEGPNPHELLECSLAACTIITLQMYANRKEMKLDSANVEVKIESETSEKTVISRKIELVGNLSPDERRRLLEIADKCPIHKLLSGPIEIVVRS